MTINPWISFNGNAEEAFSFYKSVFGGEIKNIVRLKDAVPDGTHVSDEDAHKVLRIELPIGNGNVLLANDVPSVMGTVNERENRSKIAVNVESKEEADRIFNALSDGAEIEGPMGEGPFGSYFGMLRDKYGIEWMVEFKG